jgi:uracil permease
MFLGSSFAFLPVLFFAKENGLFGQAAIAMVVVGLLYSIVAVIIGKIGTRWLDKVLPPVVIGAVIVTIGMSLLPSTVGATFNSGNPWVMLVGLFTLGVIAFLSTKASGFFRAIPILIGIIVGYIFQFILYKITGLDILKCGPSFEGINAFMLPFGWFSRVNMGDGTTMPFYNGTSLINFNLIFMFLVISISTITEHIGDNYTLSGIVGREFYKKPGLHRTILGDGLATAFAGLTGSVPNTSYGECSSTQALSKVHSIQVIIGAALIAIVLSFSGHFGAIVASIPNPVLNGACLVLYGLIALSGLKRLQTVNYDEARNLIIVSVVLTVGIGGVKIALGSFQLAGVAFATLLGVILNLILPKEKSAN